MNSTTYTDAQVNRIIEWASHLADPVRFADPSPAAQWPGDECAEMLRSLLAERKAAIQPQGGRELKLLYEAYVRTLEAGMDRITSLGSTCDSLDKMVESDPALIRARAAMASTCGVCDGPNTYDPESGVCHACQDVDDSPQHVHGDGDDRRTALPDDTRKGLYRKFEVKRIDGSSEAGGKHECCEYFVLDMNHDKHALPALAAYATSAQSEFPQLAADLRGRYSLNGDGEELINLATADYLIDQWIGSVAANGSLSSIATKELKSAFRRTAFLEPTPIRNGDGGDVPIAVVSGSDTVLGRESRSLHWLVDDAFKILPGTKLYAQTPVRSVSDEDTEWLRTHASTARKAMEIAEKHGEVLYPDIDEKAFWRHEIKALDKAIAALEQNCAGGVRS